MLNWNYIDLVEWIKTGCNNETAKKVIKLDISYNNIKELPSEIGNLINLAYFNCQTNKITKLIPTIGNLINLEYFNCQNNNITELIPEIGNLTKLEIFYCGNNQIHELIHEIGNLTNLKEFACNNNKIIELIEEFGYLTNLKKFGCNNNEIKKLIPAIGNLINLEYFNCNNNEIKELIPELINLSYLEYFHFSDNPIEYINPQILRFIKKQMNIQEIYNDSQSVHNHHIQEGITNAIKYIMSIKPTITKDELNNLIINNVILTESTKNILIEYSGNKDIHVLLNITFEELLLNIYSICLVNENCNEIFKIMNAEMNDSLCKCFTGRITRLVNCLNGFDSKIHINISDNEQIGNIIILIKNQLIVECKYDLENHKRLVKINLLEKEYELSVIEEWLEYCE